jgi:acetylglutamate kinase
MDPLYIIKIGGNIIDDAGRLSSFLSDLVSINANKILVHGGGKLATAMATKMDIPQQLIDGRRITDEETLKIITMVYAGYINKNIVAKLQGYKCNAIGLSGADANLIQAHKRIHHSIDYGFVGDVDAVNGSFLDLLLQNNMTAVIAPLSHDRNGQLLNTNADTIAREVARALSGIYDVTLIYCFEKNGVLKDVEDEYSVIPAINRERFHQLKQEGAIFAGMIPKLNNAFEAIEAGVKKVIIGNANNLHILISGDEGTTITN